MTDSDARHFPVHFRSVRMRNLDIAYREAGDAGAPVILLLHGYPTSSNMFRNLIPRLANRFRLIAPDYPGFGHSSFPDRDSFTYTFENLASLMEEFTKALALDRFALYVMDYGAPVGYRLALKAPQRITGLIVQNGNAYEEGLREFWDPLRAYWKEPSQANRDSLRVLTAAESTRWQYENGVADRSLLDPTAWLVDQAGLDRPGNQDVQLDLFYDYRTNVPLYPEFQQFLRERQPPTLVVWGKNDTIFPAEGAAPYARDLKDIETHLLDTGHFALETHGEEIARAIERFFGGRLVADEGASKLKARA